MELFLKLQTLSIQPRATSKMCVREPCCLYRPKRWRFAGQKDDRLLDSDVRSPSQEQPVSLTNRRPASSDEVPFVCVPILQ
jgi:hypothetical protein